MIRNLILAAAAAACVLMLASTASADSLGTLYARNNGGSLGGAVYFDVTVGANDLTVTGFDTNTQSLTVAFDFSVYLTAAGSTAFGNEPDAGAWTLAAEGSGIAAGTDNASAVTLDNTFVLNANQTYGMALVLGSTAAHQYTHDGAPFFSNGALSLQMGSATNAPFSPFVNSPRTWNGEIYYTVGAAPVPEPGSLALTGLVVIGALAWHRRRRIAASR